MQKSGRRPSWSALNSTRSDRSRRSGGRPAVGVQALESRVLLTTFTVTNTLDDGSAGSLRWALNQANNTAGVDTIAFNIAAASKVIRPTSELPSLWDPTVLDATTQPGYAGRPLVQVDGASAGGNTTGFKLWGNSTLKGLAITGFNGSAIDVFDRGLGGNNKIQANWIGLDLNGAAAGNNAQGVGVWGVANNLIGGPSAADRNVISASRAALGVMLQGTGATGNTVQGNYIGTDPTGTQARPNWMNGVGAQDAPRNNILNNVISGNRQDGIILINAGAVANVVKGNFVGLDYAGVNALPNGDYGIEIQSANNQIGGTAAGERNLFSSNATAGIVLHLQNCTGNIIEGNFIGTDISGTLARGNGYQGIAVATANSNTIRGNLISANRTEGIGVFPGNNNTITGNTIGFTATGGTLANGTWAVALYDSSTGNVVTGNYIAPHPSGTVGGNSNNTMGPNSSTPPTSTTNPGSFAFSAGTYSASENAGGVTITVTRTANTNVAASVTYATANGTATSGSDYTSASGTLSFAAGETSKTLVVALSNDPAVEADETVSLALSNPTGGATLASPATAVLTITNDDVAVPGSFSFGSATYPAGEAAGAVNITVNRTAGTNVPASVNYGTANGSATAGSDYAATSGTLSFAAGETSKTFTVSILNDALYEPDETVALSLSNPTGGAALVAPATAALTIASDDAAPDTTPPRVLSATFRYDSRPQALVYRFGEDVSASLSPADLYVQDTRTYLSYTPTQMTYDRASNTATFAFSQALPDGVFRALMFADGVTDAAGNQLAGDPASFTARNHVLDFFNLAGDVDRDGAVGFSDLLTVSQRYGATGATWASGDVDGDGQVGFGDLLLISQQYGQSLPFAAPSTAPAPAPAPTVSPVPAATSAEEVALLTVAPTSTLAAGTSADTPLSRRGVASSPLPSDRNTPKRPAWRASRRSPFSGHRI